MEITLRHLIAMDRCRDGADITSRRLAQLLREVDNEHPGLVDIGPVQGQYEPAGRLPYFGAILTKSGEEFLEEKGADV